jgi:signal transduction histidine kinase
LPPQEAFHADELSSFGVGISGMRARVQQFRGELQISGGPTGTIVRASIPERAASLVDTKH